MIQQFSKLISKLHSSLAKNKLEQKTNLPQSNNQTGVSNEISPHSSILNKLNPEQKLAASSTEGYVRVIAGAGSGKTRALAHRFAYLVDELGISPSKIMSVTFTNKAAGEMKKRIRSLIGDQDTAFINTFHGFCVRVLREDINHLNYPKQFVIIDEEDQKSILNEIYSELKLTVKDFTYKYVLNKIHDFKSKTPSYVGLTTSPDVVELQNLESSRNIEYMDNPDEMLEKIIFRYLLIQRKSYALDFDDLIEFVLFLYSINNNVLEKWQNRLEYIQVDEFQDVSGRQFHLVKILSEIHGNLFVVGDPDQTIYSWRGAKIVYITNFDQYFENVKTIFMNTNYRSSPEILDVSNSLINHNKERIHKDLKPVNSNGIRVLHYHAKSPQGEAQWIAKKINELNVDLSQIAILYRAHYVSRALEESFIKNEINYVVHSGISFYQRKEIKDVLCYLRLIVLEDDLAFLRVINVPSRGIGTKRLDLLKQYAQQHNVTLYAALKQNINHNLFMRTGAIEFINIIENFKGKYQGDEVAMIGDTYQRDDCYQQIKIADIVDNILKNTGYEKMLMTEGDQERLDNIAELKNSILSYETMAGEKVDIEDYLTKIALFTSTDAHETKAGVKLMTIHTAKGLEFPFVFVCGLNEGIFPSSRTRNRADLEEERRLAYVAFTRAENMLFLTDAEGFKHDGGTRYPSRFIFNIQSELIDREGVIDAGFAQQAQQEIEISEQLIDNHQQNIVYNVGDQIKHTIFGDGVIVSVNEDTKDYVIKFDNCATNRNIKQDFYGLIKN